MLYVAPERFDQGSTAERLRNGRGTARDRRGALHQRLGARLPARRTYACGGCARRSGDPVTIALTATATPEVRRDIVAQLGLQSPRPSITGFDRTNLHYHVVP
jgi:ATP-dependent DNA helicase RecQ